MSKTSDVVWPLEPHTAAKHGILRRYLSAWFPIMASRNKRIFYIDGFAGPGEYAGGEDGSPIIALKTALEQREAIKHHLLLAFIEAKQARCDHLRALVQQYQLPANFEVTVRCCPFDEKMTEVLDYMDQQNTRLAPTFAFIDPFGYSHTPFAIVKRMMAHQRCEVLITFIYEEVNRFIEHPDPDHHKHFDSLFGTPDWRDVWNIEDPGERKAFIHDLYGKQLRQGAAIKYVRSFEMTNKANRTDYFLFFGTNSLDGLKKMKEAMWKVDPEAGASFSDCTDFNQPVLFEIGPDFPALRRAILRWMGQRVVTIEQVQRFTLEETPFKDTHCRKAALKPLEEEGRLEVLSARSRRLTYPAGTRMRLKG